MTIPPRLLALIATAALGLAATADAQPVQPPTAVQPAGAPEGTWTGTSRCTAQAVICEDETIVIRINRSAQVPLYDVAFSTINGGAEMPESRLTMIYNTNNHVLTGRFNDEHKRLNFYALAVKGDNLAGVLLVDDRTIERTLTLRRSVTAPIAVPPVNGDAASSASSSSSAASSAAASSSAATSSSASSSQ